MEILGVFVIFGEFEIFFIRKTAIIFPEMPTGQRICDLLNVFNILIHDIYRKIDKNCIETSKIRKFCKFSCFGVTFGSTKKVLKTPQIHITRS